MTLFLTVIMISFKIVAVFKDTHLAIMTLDYSGQHNSITSYRQLKSKNDSKIYLLIIFETNLEAEHSIVLAIAIRKPWSTTPYSIINNMDLSGTQ